MTPLDPLTLPPDVFDTLKKGAFLTVQAEGERNVMTIGWGLLGFIWQRPVFAVPVRDSRHTYGFLERSRDFTVTLPSGDQKAALALCGTKSGRDLDKFSACGLSLRPAQRVETPVLDLPGIHLECRIVHKAPMDPGLMDPALAPLYPQKDYHTLYFGEILACYRLSA